MPATTLGCRVRRPWWEMVSRWSAAHSSCREASANKWCWREPSCAGPDLFLTDELLSNLDAKPRVSSSALLNQSSSRAQSDHGSLDQIEAMTQAECVSANGDAVRDLRLVGEYLYPAASSIRHERACRGNLECGLSRQVCWDGGAEGAHVLRLVTLGYSDKIA